MLIQTVQGDFNMDYDKLVRLLNSIGKRVFVEYYDVFKDSTLSTNEKIAKLPLNYKITGTRTRINCAKRIFEVRKQADALRIIIESKTDVKIKNMAKELLSMEL